MQGHVDEAEYLKQEEAKESNWTLEEETKDPILRVLKDRLFFVFFRVNAMKVAIARHYHILLIAIETFHLLSIVLNDGSYSALGPYSTESPWNHGQTQWLIDICWVFRVDRYLRTNLSQFIALTCTWGCLMAVLLILCLFLGYYKKTTSLTNSACKVVKLLITLLTNTLFIPICDTFAFGIKCSLSGGTECLGLSTGYLPMLSFIAAMAVFLSLCLLCSMLYYDACMVCGNVMAKPHPRFKLLRLICYTAIIMTYYFVDISGKVIVFLIIALLIGALLCYVYTQYIPYYNIAMCKIRLAAVMLFTSAVFCMLIGEFFKNTDQTNSSVSMLFYFLTPCLVQIIQLAMNRRSRALVTRKFQQITNIYQVEIKGRILIIQLEHARTRTIKSMYEEENEEPDEDFQRLQTQLLTDLENLYLEAFKKFPNSEYLYLWSGLLQLHIFKNYILAMVQCFKGIAIANKLDSQYALSYFRKTSESFYKANMKDDAYEFVQFEKCSAIAQKHDEIVTRSQFYFWGELESKSPRIQKLMKLATELTSLVLKTKSYYQSLLKLNGKSTSALRMFGGFLQSLNGYSELGQRYLQKAESQDNPDINPANPSVVNSTLQPLSFFDSENAIITVSGDFENIGEIQKVGVLASNLFGYLQAEFVGRNIALLIPEPFSNCHDAHMRQFHETGKYNTIDLQNLVLFFVNKKGFLFEARTLIKVVPNAIKPPFFLAAIKPVKQTYELAMLTTELVLTAYSQGFSDLFELGGSKSSEQRITSLIPNFEEVQSRMREPAGVEITQTREGFTAKLICHLTTLTIGKYSSFVLRVRIPNPEGEDYDVGGVKAESAGAKAAVSTLMPSDDGQKKAATQSSSEESESESDEDSDESSDEENFEEPLPSSEVQSSQHSRSEKTTISGKRKISFHEVMPGMVAEGETPNVGNETKPLIKRTIHYSDEPDIIYTESKNSSKGDKKKEGEAILEGEEEEGEEGEEESSKGGEDGSGTHYDSPHSSAEKDSDSEPSEPPEDIPEKEEPPEQHSASSKGSSMASTAQFNKAIKALMAFEFSKIKRCVLRFKITLFLTIVILIATSVTTFKVIESSVQFNEQLSHYVNLVGKLRLNSQSVSYYSRMMSLMDCHLFPSLNRSNYESWMTADIDDMHDINLILYQNFKLLEAKDKQIYFDESIPVWIREGRDTRTIKSNLFDATSNLVVQAFLLQKEAANYSFDNRRVFYLYRNGIGETLQFLNKSATFYVNAALRDLGDQRLIAIMLIVVSVILLLFCASFAIIPTIRSLEKSKCEVWDVFFEIPVYVCRIMRSKCSDRLTILNEGANLDSEEINPDGEKDDGVDEKEANGNSNHGKSKGQKGSKRRRKESRVLISHDPRQRKVIFLKLVCFLVINLVYFYLIYYTGFDAAGQILKEEPVTIDWASRRRHLSRAINHWITESLLENVTDVGYKFIVPEGQFLGSPSRQALSLINELEYVENSLIFGSEESGLSFSNLRSTEHDDLLFTSACTAPVNRSKDDCALVADKALAQGLHSALGMYITLARSVLLRINSMQQSGNYTISNIQSFIVSGEMALLRSLDEYYLYDPLKYSSDLYEIDYSSGQASMHVWQNLLISLYIVFAVLFYVFVYHPMIHKVTLTQIGQNAKDSWSMCTLMPQEYQEEFKKLNIVIKERRDRFKWR